MAALILGNEGDVDGELPILLPVAGQTLLEFQARTAKSLGAGHIVLLADRMPGALLAAIDRLKSGGVEVDVIRTAREAADSIHPDERLLVLSGGVVAPAALISKLALEEGAVLLTVAETSENQRFERIDARERWTGLAMLDGTILRETAAMLGDWQLGPTLLRIAVQQGTRRVQTDGTMIATPLNASDAMAAGATLARGAKPHSVDWFDRIAIAPLAHILARMAMARRVSVNLLAGLSIFFLLGSFATIFFGQYWAAIALFVVSALPGAIADILGQVGARQARVVAVVNMWRPYIFATIIIGVGAHLLWSGVNLVLPVAWLSSALLIGELIKARSGARAAWLSGPHAIAILMVILFAANQKVIGILLAIAYVTISQIWMLRKMPRA
jgi:hypothetical protein